MGRSLHKLWNLRLDHLLVSEPVQITAVSTVILWTSLVALVKRLVHCGRPAPISVRKIPCIEYS